MSGNPAAAGMTLLTRTVVLYHGDFDWPGTAIAIVRRIFDRGARPAGHDFRPLTALQGNSYLI